MTKKELEGIRQHYQIGTDWEWSYDTATHPASGDIKRLLCEVARLNKKIDDLVDLLDKLIRDTRELTEQEKECGLKMAERAKEYAGSHDP